MTDSVESERSAEADPTEETTPAEPEWTEHESSEGRVFVDANGERRLEVMPQTMDEWAAELYHHYGATRVAVEDTEAEVINRLIERGTLPASMR
jgi:hypothetical protein